MAVLGRGLYTFAEAARLTELDQSRVREWFRKRPPESRRRHVFSSDYEPVSGQYALSFYDLIDVYVAGHLRNHGVSLQTIRKVYAKLQEDFGTDHPFCRKELLTGGKTKKKLVFVRGLDAHGKEEILEALTRQKVFPDVLVPFLRAIDYDNLVLLARKWHITQSVVIDPEICFGAPVVAKAGIPTSILAASFRANLENTERVATWHGVTPKDVLAAVEFENRFAA